MLPPVRLLHPHTDGRDNERISSMSLTALFAAIVFAAGHCINVSPIYVAHFLPLVR